MIVRLDLKYLVAPPIPCGFIGSQLAKADKLAGIYTCANTMAMPLLQKPEPDAVKQTIESVDELNTEVLLFDLLVMLEIIGRTFVNDFPLRHDIDDIRMLKGKLRILFHKKDGVPLLLDGMQ